MKKALSLGLFVILAFCSLYGQDIIFESYPAGVDFWVLVPYNTIIFKKGTDTAQYQLTMEIRNSGRKQVLSFEDTIVIPKRDWLQNNALPVLFQGKLDPGKYTVQLRLRNTVLGDKSDLKKTCIIEEYYTEIGQPYFIVQKDGIRYIPSDLNELPIPLEACALKLKYTVEPDSLQISIDDHLMTFSEPRNEITADLTEFVNAADTGNMTISIYEENIRYYMDPFLFNQWFSYNVSYSAKDQIQQLRYIANQNEWKSIHAATEEMYPEIIERFWQVHDPSPGTVRNEARENFYQRVIIADERYTIHKRLKGWSSDRGRIYIKYGEPDEIHSDVHPIDLYPYIIWIYYRENLEFDFADTGGFGQYKLRNKDEEY